MIEIAVSNRTALTLSTLEHLLPTPSYTIDTIRYLLEHSGHLVEFFFITGADTFLDIPSWKEYPELLRLIHFIVFSRKGCDNEKLYKLFEQLGYQHKKDAWCSRTSKKWIYCSSVTPPSVSSSEIRERVVKGFSVDKLLPEGVCEYIQQHEIYSVR